MGKKSQRFRKFFLGRDKIPKKNCFNGAVWYNVFMVQDDIKYFSHCVQPLLQWFRKEKRDLPWRHTDDPYRIWVSEIMLQQTRVEAVKGYYARFLEAFPTVYDLAAADEQLCAI